MSAVTKGNYYRARTREWLESQGFLVEVLERSQRIVVRDKRTQEPRVIFIKRDVWGADLVARNAERLVFIQVKSNAGDIAKGMKELSQGPWPASVERWVAHWPKGRRMVEGPEVVEVRP